MGHMRAFRGGTRPVLWSSDWLGIRECLGDQETEGGLGPQWDPWRWHSETCLSGLVTLPTLSLQDLETRNVELEHQLRVTERSLEEARAERERARAEVGRAAQLLDVRLFELSELREGLARLAEGAP